MTNKIMKIIKTRIIPDVDQLIDSKGNPITQQPTCDKLINAEIMLQSNSALEKGNFVGRFIVLEGVIIGSHDENPKFNYIVYDDEFSNCQIKELI